MARHAIHRNILLLVAAHAKPHRVIHFSLCDGLLSHIAVAYGAIDSHADVRGVIELHMRRRLKAVHALPGNIFPARTVCGEFLNLRLVRGDHLMAGHAEIDAGDSRIGALVYANVAIGTLHAVAEMHFVRIGDRLHGCRAKTEKLADSGGNSAMLRCENVGNRWLGRRWRSLRGRDVVKDRRANHEHTD